MSNRPSTPLKNRVLRLSTIMNGAFIKEFKGSIFTVTFNNADSKQLAEILFCDIPAHGETTEHSGTVYDILSVGRQPMLSLWKGEQRLYFGTSQYELAYRLMNEVLYNCIASNIHFHALHAGAVYKDGQAILLPGGSGSGKSTLTSWLLAMGCHYLTDELVMLKDSGTIHPFTRPISLKSGGLQPLRTLLQNTDSPFIDEEGGGALVPHRLFNPNYHHCTPVVNTIVYPSFHVDSPLKLLELTPARSSLYLMKSHVNARNLDDLGVSHLFTIVRNCRSYSLTYSSFDGLWEMLNRKILSKNYG